MMPAFPCTRPLLVATACAGALALSGSGDAFGSAARHAAGAAKACNISGHEESLGPTYVTYIGVSGGATCSEAMRLVRAYYHCRIKHGGVTGHCSGVEGFRCTENRYAAIAVQYDSRVLCTRGRESIRHNYTQFT
jgi:hypothetical protein